MSERAVFAEEQTFDLATTTPTSARVDSLLLLLIKKTSKTLSFNEIVIRN